MKVLHVVYGYPPDASGGTERYVEVLAAGLAGARVTSVVAAPAASEAVYEYGGVSVHRFAMSAELGLDQVYGAGDPVAAASFARVVEGEQPDLVHLHAITPACSVQLVRVIEQRNLPMVLTYHTPTVTCLRGTMMLWGEAACDGEMQVVRCASCAAAAHGVGRPLAEVVGHLPILFGRGLARLGVSGGPMTAARLSSLASIHREATLEILNAADRIVALAPWVRSVLTLNGVPTAKIVDSPHGVSGHSGASTRRRRPDGLTRIVHLGRLHATKGTELLVAAFESVRSDRLRLDIYGIAQDEAGSAMGGRLRAAAARDTRIQLNPPIEPDRVMDHLTEADAVVVSSQWMETGPLVLLEAFAAGVPVLGSRLGGIADKVSHERDGLLVSPPDSEAAWAEALRRCVEDPALLPRLRRGVRPPRSQQDVVADMVTLYSSVLGRSPTPDACSTGAA